MLPRTTNHSLRHCLFPGLRLSSIRLPLITSMLLPPSYGRTATMPMQPVTVRKAANTYGGCGSRVQPSKQSTGTYWSVASTQIMATWRASTPVMMLKPLFIVEQECSTNTMLRSSRSAARHQSMLATCMPMATKARTHFATSASKKTNKACCGYGQSPMLMIKKKSLTAILLLWILAVEVRKPTGVLS